MTWLRKSGCFEPPKHFCQHFISMRLLTVIQIFWNHLCTHFTDVQILCNNLVDHTFTNIKLIVDHLYCQMSIFINESLHMVDICACSHKGRASRSWFIFHGFLPIYKVFVPPKYFSMWYKITAEHFLNLFVGIGSALTQAWHKTWFHNAAWDSPSPFLWCCNNTYIYTNHNRTTCIHASKFKLGLKVEVGCNYHLTMVSALHCYQFLHCKTNLIISLTHLIQPHVRLHRKHYFQQFLHCCWCVGKPFTSDGLFTYRATPMQWTFK
jgi:hypothetical protein